MSVEERIAAALERMAQVAPPVINCPPITAKKGKPIPAEDERPGERTEDVSHEGTEEEWPETVEDAIKILQDLPVVEGSPIPWEAAERFESTDLNIGGSLPGEGAFVALISLVETMFEGATPEQKEVLINFLIEDRKAWNKFWKIGDA